jgi:hypothetical protein
LTPVADAAAEPKPKPKPRDDKAARRARAIEICKELKSRSRLGISAVADLLGLRPVTVWCWIQSKPTSSGKMREPPNAQRLAELERLLARSRSAPEGSTSLRDEARGASRQRARQGSRARGLTADQKLAIGVMRESGSSLNAIAKAFGICARTAKRILDEVGG